MVSAVEARDRLSNIEGSISAVTPAQKMLHNTPLAPIANFFAKAGEKISSSIPGMSSGKSKSRVLFGKLKGELGEEDRDLTVEEQKDLELLEQVAKDKEASRWDMIRNLFISGLVAIATMVAVAVVIEVTTGLGTMGMIFSAMAGAISFLGTDTALDYRDRQKRHNPEQEQVLSQALTRDRELDVEMPCIRETARAAVEGLGDSVVLSEADRVAPSARRNSGVSEGDLEVEEERGREREGGAVITVEDADTVEATHHRDGAVKKAAQHK